MKAIALTNFGIEDIAAKDIKDIIGKDASTGKGHAEFEAKSHEELFELAYSAQAISKVALVLDKGKFKSKEEIVERFPEIDFSEWLVEDATFAVRCQREGQHDFKSVDIEMEASQKLAAALKLRFDIKKPQIVVFVYIADDEFFIGIDISGKDLSKRDYKIFNSPYSIKPTIAYAISRIADVKDGEEALDPFCNTGEITIETALYLSKMSPCFYSKKDFLFVKMPQFKERDFDKFFENIDKKKKEAKSKIHAFDHQMRNVMAIKKNAKIAGINKEIHIARVDTDWIELKIEEGKIDKIITRLPNVPKNERQKAIEKVIDDFFYQAEYVLNKNGKITALLLKKEDIAKAMEKYKFELKSEREVWQGKEKYIIVEIAKKH